MTNNAKRGIELNKKVNGRCATSVGKTTSRILASRGTLSDARVRRMHSYLQRAETYYDPNDSTACGTISYLLWGGKAAKRWAEARFNEMEAKRTSEECSKLAAMENVESELRQTYGESVESRVVEIRAKDEGDKLVVEGYAAKYDDVTNIGYFNERIERGAFDEVLQDDVRFLLNHKGMPLARTTNGTLQMEAREDGLWTRAELSNTTQGRDVYEAVKRGDISQMSFAFTIGEDEMDKKSNTRTIKRVKEMYDVSAVSFPAYPTTTLEARERAALQEEQPAEVREHEKAEDVAEDTLKTATTEHRTFVTKDIHSMNLNDLRGQRTAYYEEFVAIGKLADEEGRAMTEAEQERADSLDGHIKATDQKIKHKEREQEMVARMAVSNVSGSTSEQKEVESVNYRYSLTRAINAVRNQRNLEGAEAEWTQEASRELRSSGLQMSGHIGIPASALLRAGTADDFQATATGDGSGFVSTGVPAAIEALRAPTVLESLGANTIQAQGNIKMPRIKVKANTPVAGEVSAYDSADMELDEVVLTPQRAGSTTLYSKQLLVQGGAAVDALIAGDLRAALGEIVDTTGFATILAESANDTTSAVQNTAADADAAVGLESAVLHDGADMNGCAYVMSSTAYTHFKQQALVNSVLSLYDPTNQTFNGYRMVATPHLTNTSGTTTGKVLFGNFRQGMMLAYFGGIDILVDPFTEAGTGQVRLHATRFFDCAMRQKAAIAMNTKIATGISA